MKKVDRAILFAAQAHAGQFRDGEDALPYIVHPIEVLTNLRVIGEVTDPKHLAAAVLHDVLEETTSTEEEIEKLFGKSVLKLVKEVTRREPTEEEVSGRSKDEIWALRSGMLLAEIAAMGKKAQAIKLADRLSNLTEAARTRKGKRLQRYLAQTEEMLAIIPRSVNPTLHERLATLATDLRTHPLHRSKKEKPAQIED
jgi:guanosine-3',5'-bis(diphosphate) 3'-pyrophosphohydrolase